MSDQVLEQLTDEELILRYQNDDDVKPFEILVKRYKNPLYNYVFRFLNDYEVTGDVVQETMIKVYRNKHSYKTVAKFSTWIYTIAGNLARTELQKRKRHKHVSIDDYGDEHEQMDLPDASPQPDAEVDALIKDKMIQEALMKVTPIYRELVILRDIQEFSYEEIAEMMNLSIGTVKSRINRGRAQLQDLLKGIYRE